MFIPYEVPTVPFPGGHTEVMARGAFRGALRHEPLELLIDHEPRLSFASTSDGSLSVHENDRGLFVTLMSTSAEARSLCERAERREFRGVSVGFLAVRDSWSQDRTARTIEEAAAYEVSLCTRAGACPAAAYRFIEF